MGLVVVIPGGSRGLLLDQSPVDQVLALILGGLRFRSPLLWTYNPLTGRYLPLKRCAGSFKRSIFSGAVYHCVDRIHAQPGMPAQLIDESERKLCRTVDLVFTTSPELQASLLPLNRCTYYYGNVADQAHFSAALDKPPAPAQLVDLPKPRLMFVGAIDAYKLDLPMLTTLARRRSDWSFVLVGPVGETDPETSIDVLRALPNVHVMGLQAYADLPAWLAHADVALLPLQDNTYQHVPMSSLSTLRLGAPLWPSDPCSAGYASAALLCPLTRRHSKQDCNGTLGRWPNPGAALALAAEHTYEAA